MKTLRLFVFFLFIGVAALGFYACSDDDEPAEVEPLLRFYFEIEKSGYSINSEAQTFDVHVRTNITGISTTFTNAKDNEWITVSLAKQEKENLTFLVSVKENTDSDKRDGCFVFIHSSGALIDGLNTIVITQAGTDP